MRVVHLPLGTPAPPTAPEHRGVLAEEQRDPVEARRRPRRPRRSRRAGRAARAGSRERAAAAPRTPRATTGSDSACSGTSASRRVARRSTPCQRRQEAPERRLLGRLDLLAQRGERRAAQPAEDVGVAPLALGAARPQLAADELLLALERAQLGLDVAAEVVVRLAGRERAARARVPRDERAGAARAPLSRKTSGSPDGGIAPSASR